VRTPGLVFLSGLLAAVASAQQPPSYLTRARCRNPLTNDSTSSIRIVMDPAKAGGSLLGLRLFRVTSRGDSSVAWPALGTDSLRVRVPGLYRLWVQQIGYYPIRDTLRIGAGESWCPVAHMVRDTVRLEVSNP